MSEPIRVMLGGSAANFAVHAANLNRGDAPVCWRRREAAGTDGPGDGAPGGSDEPPRQACVLHTSLGNEWRGGGAMAAWLAAATTGGGFRRPLAVSVALGARGMFVPMPSPRSIKARPGKHPRGFGYMLRVCPLA